MDVVKEAFEKIKIDISSLKLEISLLRQQLFDIQKHNQSLKFEIEQLQIEKTQQRESIPTHNPTHQQQNQAENHPPTSTPTHNPTHQPYLKALNNLNNAISIGNRGVPTDKPTNRQTNQQTDKSPISKSIIPLQNPLYIATDSPRENPKNELKTTDSFEKAREILDSLDNLRKDIRLKFKRLTPQEMEVFSTIYSLQERFIDEISYRTLAQQLKLSESSIRDYITRLVTKGIPILKIKRDNKKIEIKISPDLQKIASLSTIIKLREL